MTGLVLTSSFDLRWFRLRSGVGFAVRAGFVSVLSISLRIMANSRRA